jgi:branched-chain amino acid transport system substrate-binding protein
MTILLIPNFALSAKDPSIVIGVVFPMTGPIATFGQESVNGIKLALKKINLTPIHGKRIEIIVEDTKGEPVDTASAARKLISVDHVMAIIGDVASSNTLAAAPIAQSEKVPMLTPASTNEAVTKTGDYISRTCFTDGFQGQVMAKFATQTLKAKKVAVIVDLSSDYSKGLAKVFRQKFKEMGGEIVDDEFSYSQKDTDFRSLLRKVGRTKPDAVFLPGYYTEVGLILNQARSMDLKFPFLGGDGWHSDSLYEMAGVEGIKNNYYSSHFSPMAALGYDGIMVMADALRRSKKVDRNDLRLAIAETKNYSGVTGNITLDANRDAQKSAVVLETTKDGSIFKEKINP